MPKGSGPSAFSSICVRGVQLVGQAVIVAVIIIAWQSLGPTQGTPSAVVAVAPQQQRPAPPVAAPQEERAAPVREEPAAAKTAMPEPPGITDTAAPVPEAKEPAAASPQQPAAAASPKAPANNAPAATVRAKERVMDMSRNAGGHHVDGAPGWNGLEMDVDTPSDAYSGNGTDKAPWAAALEPVPRKWPKGDKAKAKFAATFGFQYTALKAAGKLPVTAKKAWIDAGARDFNKGSTQWFMKSYPGSSDGFEASLFDVLKWAEGTYPQDRMKSFFSAGYSFSVSAVWTHDKGVEIRGQKMGHAKDKGAEDPIDVAFGQKDSRELWSVPSVDFSAWLQGRYTKDDFVVLKMDIEGGEWEVLEHMFRTGAASLIDEMMLECHARARNWMTKEVHPQCVDL
eukprot:CAMPEP_0174874244 /NCGR_PEP_ID=MMETSP1114-20130205/76348_1 /TAXON_ID=312471 /ORGANISM="Neobodo designis, Strain CCAP 1951/1" /LENGTH=396 /DNA_ID=CAMNT_0016109575 /DNA_START=45 /DNA_END=1231 /DNA_ORIENTATION=-